MARVAGVNIPDKKQAWVSLTHIFGIEQNEERCLFVINWALKKLL